MGTTLKTKCNTLKDDVNVIVNFTTRNGPQNPCGNATRHTHAGPDEGIFFKHDQANNLKLRHILTRKNAQLLLIVLDKWLLGL